MYRLITLTALALCALSRIVLADVPVEADDQTAMKRLANSLVYRKGEITLKDGLAKLRLPQNFRYLDSHDANTLFSGLWKNPPSQSLGVIVPSGFSPFSPNAWAVLITYDEDGHVKDDEASKIDYNKLLKDMQEQARQANPEREKQGYPSVELVGWAAPPRYDQATHKLYWAKEIRFGDSAESTLNYNIRLLGRKGVLVLNAVAPMDKLPEIEAATPSILSMVDFQEGHRYTDFNPSTDKVATYGLIGLIAGGVLAKAGFFKLLIPAILAAKKIVFVAVVAIVAAVKKLFAKLTGRDTTRA